MTEELGSGVAGLDERLDAVESLFLLLTCSGPQRAALRSVLRCIVTLCHLQRSLCPRFVQLIATCLIDNTAGQGFYDALFIIESDQLQMCCYFTIFKSKTDKYKLFLHRKSLVNRFIKVLCLKFLTNGYKKHSR